MGAGRTTTWKEVIALQIGLPIQVCISFEEVQVQSSARRQRIQRRIWVDYDEIFSPVVKLTTLRLLLGVVATKDKELKQLDVKTTFLHKDLEEDIYMSQPAGFTTAGEEGCKESR